MKLIICLLQKQAVLNMNKILWGNVCLAYNQGFGREMGITRK